MILGNNELSMPVTSEQLDDATSFKERLALLASIVGPLQPHLQQCLRSLDVQRESLDYHKKQVEDLRTSLMSVLRHEINNYITDKVDESCGSFISTDNITDTIMEELENSRRIRSEIEEIASHAFDIDDLKHDITRDIERDLGDTIEEAIDSYDLDTKISDALASHDFGDILDDHTRDLDANIIKRLTAEISDDPHHPLVSAIVNALVLRFARA